MNKFSIGDYFQNLITKVNTSKYFAGIILLIMNIGSRYITIKLSKTHEELIKNTITSEILIFSILFISTRDIIISIVLTAVFKILSDHLFNEKSKMCMIPKKYQKIYSAIDTNKDGIISEDEIDKALGTLNKAQKQKGLDAQKNALLLFQNSFQ